MTAAIPCQGMTVITVSIVTVIFAAVAVPTAICAIPRSAWDAAMNAMNAMNGYAIVVQLFATIVRKHFARIA